VYGGTCDLRVRCLRVDARHRRKGWCASSVVTSTWVPAADACRGLGQPGNGWWWLADPDGEGAGLVVLGREDDPGGHLGVRWFRVEADSASSGDAATKAVLAERLVTKPLSSAIPVAAPSPRL
jgi:hypothetical protein